MSCSPRDLVKRVAIPIASFAGSAGPTGANVVLWMTNPSVLLTAMVTIFLQRATGSTAALAASSWQISSALPTAPEILSPQILGTAFSSARALPDAYVVDDPTKLLQIAATLASADDNQAGSVWAVATWEGRDACLAGQLRRELFALCDLTLEGGLRSLRAGPGV